MGRACGGFDRNGLFAHGGKQVERGRKGRTRPRHRFVVTETFPDANAKYRPRGLVDFLLYHGIHRGQIEHGRRLQIASNG